MAHANFEFGENSLGRCLRCDSRTVLISFIGYANVDDEPFESGEFTDESPEAKSGVEIPDDVHVDDEITGHYCIKCDALTSLCLNASRRQHSVEMDPELEVTLFRQRMADRGVDVHVAINAVGHNSQLHSDQKPETTKES